MSRLLRLGAPVRLSDGTLASFYAMRRGEIIVTPRAPAATFEKVPPSALPALIIPATEVEEE